MIIVMEGIHSPEQDYTKHLSRAESLIRVVSNASGIRVGKNGRGQGDYFSPDEKAIKLDPNDLDRSEAEWLGITAHEGMHARITDWDEIQYEVMESRAFNLLMQTLEDTRVNHALTEMFPGAGEWVRTAVRGEVRSKGRLDLESAKDQVTQVLGYVPRHIQVCIQLQKRWAFGNFDDEMDTVTRDYLEKIGDAALSYQQTIPELTDSGEKIKEMAAKNCLYAKENIWPIFENLYKSDQEDAAIIQLITDLINSKYNIDELKAGLNAEDQKELDVMVDKVLSMLVNNYLDLSNMSPTLRRALINKSVKEKRTNSNTEDLGAQDGSSITKSPSDMSQEKLDQVARLLLSTLIPRLLTASGTRSVKEMIQSVSADHDQAYEDKELMTSQREHNELEFSKHYEDLKDQVLPEVIKQSKALNKILKPNAFPRWQKGFANGPRPTMAKAMQFDATGTGINTMWETKSMPDRKDYNVYVLLDWSGSMARDTRILNSQLSAVYFNEVFDKIGMSPALEMCGFDDWDERELSERFLIKSFDQGNTREVKERIEKMNTMVRGGTEMDMFISWATQRLNSRRSKNNFLIVVTDGVPKDMYLTIDKIGQAKKDGHKVVGVGIGESGVDAVKDIFPNTILVPDVKQLAVKSSQLIEDMILKPYLYQ